MQEKSEEWITLSGRDVQRVEKKANRRNLAEERCRIVSKRGSWKAGQKGRSKMVDIESSEYQEKWSGDQGEML